MPMARQQEWAPPSNNKAASSSKSFLESRYSVEAEFLWFKPTDPTLKFAEYIPQTETFEPKIFHIGSQMIYQPGFRIGVSLAPSGEWELGGTWMFYQAAPAPSVQDTDDFSLYANWATTSYNQPAYNLLNLVDGEWRAKLNVFDFEFRSPFQIGGSLVIRPILGVRGAIFENRTTIGYGEYITNRTRAVPSDLLAGVFPPQKVSMHQRTWGVGPEVGAEVRLSPYKLMDILFKASFAPLTGIESLKAVYSDFGADTSGNTLPPQATLTFLSNISKALSLFPMTQINAAVSKRWLGKKAV